MRCACSVTSVMSNSLRSHGLQPARLLYPRGLSRQEYWRGLPCPPPGDLPDPGAEPAPPAPQREALPLSHWGSPFLAVKDAYTSGVQTWVVIRITRNGFLFSVLFCFVLFFMESEHLIIEPRVCCCCFFNFLLWFWCAAKSVKHCYKQQILWVLNTEGPLCSRLIWKANNNVYYWNWFIIFSWSASDCTDWQW